jgi:hypothetical protein
VSVETEWYEGETVCGRRTVFPYWLLAVLICLVGFLPIWAFADGPIFRAESNGVVITLYDGAL